MAQASTPTPSQSSPQASQLGSQGLPPGFVPLPVTDQVGPWVVGGLLDVFLAGFALSLVLNYFYDTSPKLRLLSLLIRSKTNTNTNNSRWQKQKQNVAIPGPGNLQATRNSQDSQRWASASCQILVAIATALSTFKTISAVHIVLLIGFIRRDDDAYLATISFTNWACISCPITTSLIGLTVQIFYINRLHKLLRAQDDSFLSSLWFRGLLMAIIISLGLISVAFAGVVTQLIPTTSFLKMDTFFSAHLGTMFGSDALITTFTIICMLRTGQRVLTSKRSLLSRFVRFTVFSAAIPAILALLNLAFILAKNQQVVRWQPVINFGLGKAYLFTLLWTLEYRKRVAIESANSHHIRPHEPTSIVNSGSRSERSPPPHAFSFARTVSYYDIELQKPPTLP